MSDQRVTQKKIVIGSDHYGLLLKNAVREHLQTCGYEVDDLGVTTDAPVDYPDVGLRLAEAVAQGLYDRGVLVCGTGAGMAIVANKVPGVRAVCVHDPYTAERARASNNAQIITMGSEVIGPGVARKLVEIWLASEFQSGRSGPKVAKINQIDRRYHQPVRTRTA
jgi:ribose 5-phosphate isomerase B